VNKGALVEAFVMNGRPTGYSVVPLRIDDLAGHPCRLGDRFFAASRRAIERRASPPLPLGLGLCCLAVLALRPSASVGTRLFSSNRAMLESFAMFMRVVIVISYSNGLCDACHSFSPSVCRAGRMVWAWYFLISPERIGFLPPSSFLGWNYDPFLAKCRSPLQNFVCDVPFDGFFLKGQSPYPPAHATSRRSISHLLFESMRLRVSLACSLPRRVSPVLFPPVYRSRRRRVPSPVMFGLLSTPLLDRNVHYSI